MPICLIWILVLKKHESGHHFANTRLFERSCTSQRAHFGVVQRSLVGCCGRKNGRTRKHNQSLAERKPHFDQVEFLPLLFVIYYQLRGILNFRETLNYMNFPPEYTKNLYHFPLEKIDKVQVCALIHSSRLFVWNLK